MLVTTSSFRVIGLVLVLIIGFASPAVSWKIDMHVWIAQQVLNDARDGKITLDFDGRARAISLPPRVTRALRNYPNEFLVGSLGPDAFPDVTAGQLIIHPSVEGGWGTRDWLIHISEGNLSDRELSFAMGYLTHASADIFAHTFVNRYAGDLFEVLEHPTAAVRVEVRTWA